MPTTKPIAVKERDARGRWVPGVSGNDLGRPRTALSELCRHEITKHGLVAVLGSLAAGREEAASKSKIPITVADRIGAIRLLLLYGYGMPKGELDTGDVRIEVTYADNRSIAVTNATSGASPDHSGGETFQRRLLRPPLGQDDFGNESSDPSSAER